jgi:chemotaxis protein MotB
MSKSKRGHDEEHEEGPSSERWLLTYSDMITLLMVLFIVLFALGQTDIRKFNAFKDSFRQLTSSINDNTPQGGPGILSEPSAIALIMTNPFAKLEISSANSASGAQPTGDQSPGQSASHPQNGQSKGGLLDNVGKGLTPGQEKAVLAKAASELEKALAQKDLSQDVNISLDRSGLVVSILTDKVLFALDSAQLEPAGQAVIDAIAPVLATLPNEIAVEGDTDNTPIHGGPYATNWALSAARAVAVLTNLVDSDHVNPARLEAIGYGDTRPLVPNNTAAHRAENRRVEIVIFSTTVATP